MRATATPATHSIRQLRMDTPQSLRYPGSARAPGAPPSNTLRWGDPLQRLIPPHIANNALDRCAESTRPSHLQSTPQPHLHRLSPSLCSAHTRASNPSPRNKQPLGQTIPKQPQTSKQSRACVRNIAWNSNCLPRPQNHLNSSTTCGFSFILQSLK